MIFTAKYAKVHGMRDKRWTYRDKLNQYRGILRLNERNKKLRLAELKKLKIRVSRDFNNLLRDVMKYRKIFKNLITVDNSHLLDLLEDHKDLQLELRNRNALEILDAVTEDTNDKYRQLEKINYENKNKMKQYGDLKTEFENLKIQYKKESDNIFDIKRQHLITNYMHSMSKRNAAAAIRIAYENAIRVLKKDAMYFDTLAEALKEDQKNQAKIIVKTTMIGQLAAEDLNDTRKLYNSMAVEVWNSMKKREKTLDATREKAKDLWEYAKSLIRTEADPILLDSKYRKTSPNTEMKQQIEYLERIIDKLKMTFRVLSFDNLYTRLLEQKKKEKRLIEERDYNIKISNSLNQEIHDSSTKFKDLKREIKKDAEKHEEINEMFLNEIKIQVAREQNFKILTESSGKSIINIRLTLQAMADMLVCVKKVKKKSRTKRISTRDSMVVKEDLGPEMEETENNVLTLLALISKKAGTLVAMCSLEIDIEKLNQAKDAYYTYIADHRSKLKFHKNEGMTAFEMDTEILNISVPTRGDIKLQSKRIVDTHTKFN